MNSGKIGDDRVAEPKIVFPNDNKPAHDEAFLGKPADSKFCRDCGKPRKEFALFCANCGCRF